MDGLVGVLLFEFVEVREAGVVVPAAVEEEPELVHLEDVARRPLPPHPTQRLELYYRRHHVFRFYLLNSFIAKRNHNQLIRFTLQREETESVRPKWRTGTTI